MSTTVTVWPGVELADLGAIAPYLSSEVALTIGCVILIVGWFFWLWSFESQTYVRDPENIARAMRKKTLHKAILFMVIGSAVNTASANPGDAAYYQKMMQLKQIQGAERISHVNIPYGHYYQAGDQERVCYSEAEPLLIAMGHQCVIERVLDSSIFSLRHFSEEVNPQGPGLSPQQYLDERFGAEKTKLIKTVYARAGMSRILEVHFTHLCCDDTRP